MGKLSFVKEAAQQMDSELGSLLTSFVYTVYGCRALELMGHKGILHFSDKEMIFQTDGGKLTVTGEDLKLKQLTSRYAFIVGKTLRAVLQE